MARMLDAPGKLSTWVWSFCVALIVEGTLDVRWWHPYCEHPSSSTGFTAFGFPLPYGQPVGVSLDYVFMPHMLILDVILIASVCFPLIHALLRRFRVRFSGVSRVVNISGPLLFVILVTIYVKVMSNGFTPVSSIALNADGYWSYRPAAIAQWIGKKACYV